MINILNLKKVYGSAVILDVPALTLEPNIYYIKGENGSGKSTFLKILAGLLPFEGTISFNNEIDLIKNPLAYRKLVNYGAAEPMYPHFLMGNDLIKFFEKTKKAPTFQANRLIERFNFQEFLNNPIGTYSSGTLKKLSLILAFIGSPKLLLLDEPLTTIDAETVSALYTLINEYYTKDMVLILSSHHRFTDKLIINGTLEVGNHTISLK
ncbi:MAG: ATP-binding cassette domain-containing protein [Bacteroidia bacterium]